MNVITQWAEQGYLPDRIIRFMIRMLLQARLKKEGSLAFSERLNALYTFRDQLHKEPIAHAVDSANQQHYEVPADLFETFMGPHLKYSSGFWADDATTLVVGCAAASPPPPKPLAPTSLGILGMGP